MRDWNVVVTTREEGFEPAKVALRELGPVSGTDYFNVLVMRVPDPRAFADRLLQWLETNPLLKEWLGRVTPAQATFNFQTQRELEDKAKETLTPWLEHFRGQRFHVRMHRRGFKGRISSQEEERFLDRFLVAAFPEAGDRPAVDFEDPDLILDLETVGQRAGLALWTRADLGRYPFLRLD
jgi:tRNA(Ser,Leu) C12 N-acetylase TAN1